MSDFLAKSELGDAYVPEQLFAGSADIVTAAGTLVSGQNLAQFAVVGRITASGKLKVWNPAGTDGSELACGILLHAIDASAADKACEIYVSGTFNIDALVWPSATDAQKAGAFSRTPINVRKLG